MTDILQSTRDNARKKTFKHNAVKITVREGVGSDRFVTNVYNSYVLEKVIETHNADLPKKEHITTVHDSIWRIIQNFTVYVIRTTKIQGKMPEKFQLPPMYGDEDEWYEAYCKFLTLPVDLMGAWDKELVAINEPVPAPEALPGDESSTTNT